MRCRVTVFLLWTDVVGDISGCISICQLYVLQGRKNEHKKGVQMAKAFQLRWDYPLYPTIIWENCICTDIAYECWKVWTAHWGRATNNLRWPCCYLDCSSASTDRVMNKMSFSEPYASLASGKLTKGHLADKLIYSSTSFPGC